MIEVMHEGFFMTRTVISWKKITLICIIIIELIILSWVNASWRNIYRPHLSDIQRQTLTLTSISWSTVQYKKHIFSPPPPLVLFPEHLHLLTPSVLSFQYAQCQSTSALIPKSPPKNNSNFTPLWCYGNSPVLYACLYQCYTWPIVKNNLFDDEQWGISLYLDTVHSVLPARTAHGQLFRHYFVTEFFKYSVWATTKTSIKYSINKLTSTKNFR
jgi:hypothetical protein